MTDAHVSADIVDRLRKHVNNRGGPSLDNGAWQMMLDAADTIEALKEANNTWVDLHGPAPLMRDLAQPAGCCKGLAPVAECRCEQERLQTCKDIFRSALLDIKAASVPDQPASSQADEVSWVMQHVGAIRRIASKALEETAASQPSPAAPVETVSKYDLASAVHAGRFASDHPAEFITSFDDERSPGREYCFRIATSIMDKFDVVRKGAPVWPSSAVTAGLIDQGRPACGQGDEWGNKPTDDQLAAQIERIIRANRLDGIPQISRKIADFLDPPQAPSKPEGGK